MSDGGQDPADIGRQIAALRRGRGMKMVDLSRAAGISPSMISQIERGHALPSVSTLYAIAEALGVTVHDLFAAEGHRAMPASDSVITQPDEGPAVEAGTTVLEQLTRHRMNFDWTGPGSIGPVVRGGERQFCELAGGVRWERLTPADLPDIDILATEYRPGAASSEHLYRHHGQEMHLVTEGRLVIELAFQRYELEAGDSITFDSTEPHRYSNPYEETARGVSVLLLGVTG